MFCCNYGILLLNRRFRCLETDQKGKCEAAPNGNSEKQAQVTSHWQLTQQKDSCSEHAFKTLPGGRHVFRGSLFRNSRLKKARTECAVFSKAQWGRLLENAHLRGFLGCASPRKGKPYDSARPERWIVQHFRLHHHSGFFAWGLGGCQPFSRAERYVCCLRTPWRGRSLVLECEYTSIVPCQVRSGTHGEYFCFIISF